MTKQRPSVIMRLMLFKRHFGESIKCACRGRFFGFLVCTLVAITLLSVTFQKHNLNPVKVFSTPSLLVDKKPFDLTLSKSYAGLPVAEVKSYPAPHSWGTVVFLPQYHKNPGTDLADKKNDSAQIAQEEIYKLVKFLTSKPDMHLVMVEGELYGEVSTAKIARLRQEIADRDELLADCDKLDTLLKKNGIDPKIGESLHQKVMVKAAEVDREVILAGAPLKLKAEGTSIDLFGLENSDTLSESTELARNYIYMQDRMDQLKGDSLSYQQENSLGFLGQGNDRSFTVNENLLKLLKQFLGGGAPYEFRELETLASTQGKDELLGLIKKTENVFNRLSGRNQTQATLTSSGPSRSDNPYKNINDQQELQSMMAGVEKQIDQVIVDKRNHETAVNFAKALKEKGETTGIIEFGAGHEKGLTEELNKQGLSVVVVTSKEVQRRNAS